MAIPLVLSTEPARARAVAFALAVAAGTPVSPGPYERALLALFVQGLLDLDALQRRLDVPPPAPSRTQGKGQPLGSGSVLTPGCVVYLSPWPA